MALVFWFIILPLLALIPLLIFVKILLPFALRFVASSVEESLDKKFERDYKTVPVSDEKVQRKMSLTFWGRWAMLIFGIAMIIFPIVKLINEGTMYLSEALPYAAVGALGFGVFILGRRSRYRTKQLAALIAEPVIREVFGADCHYEELGHIPVECIQEAGFVPDYDRIYGTDFVRGEYRGIKIMFSDVTLVTVTTEYNSDTKKEEEREHTKFSGQWLVADFDRQLTEQAVTVVEKRASSRSIQMESEAFNRQFSVFCADPHTAFYVLTPHFMEHLVAVDALANGTSHFQFSGNRMQIAIGDKGGLFEAYSYTAPNVVDMRERFRKELGYLTTVLDEMLTHERIFGKQEENCGE